MRVSRTIEPCAACAAAVVLTHGPLTPTATPGDRRERERLCAAEHLLHRFHASTGRGARSFDELEAWLAPRLA